MRPSPSYSITLRGTGWRGALVVLAVAAFGLFGLPRLLSSPPSAAEAQQLVRALHSRQVSAPFLARLENASADSVAMIEVEMARALGEVDRTTFSDVRVRRSLLGPPFARRFAYAVAVRESGSADPGYYRVSRGMAHEASRLYWLVPVF